MTQGTIEQVLSGEAAWCVLCGDCRDLFSGIPDNSVDSIVTDPTYEINFTGGWDRSGIAFDPKVWSEAMRLLKPGGHVAAFGASRTYHRLACALEDCGFEIRDCIDMIYGSGAAHAKDASKAIDEHDGVMDQRPVVGSYKVSGNAGTSTAEKGGTFGVGVPNSAAVTLYRTTGATERSQAFDGWHTNLAPGKEPVVLARKPLEGTLAENLIKWGTGALNIDATRIATDFSERGESWRRSAHSANPEAEKIASPPGAGMLLHPKGRWAHNVVFIHDFRCQKLGERAAKAPIINRHVGGPRYFGNGVGASFVSDGGEQTTEVLFKCHPDCPVYKLGVMSGESVSRIGKPRTGIRGNAFAMTATGTEYDDEGTAARYFNQFEWTEPDFELFRYIKKPGTAERELGCEEVELASVGEMKGGRKPGSPGCSHFSSGPGGASGRHNNHTTVKSIEFVRWLVRLTTPPGGVTLSPFLGSGTDTIAAQAEGVRAIGFELIPRHVEIALARIEHWTQDDCRLLHSCVKPKLVKKNDRQVELFNTGEGK